MIQTRDELQLLFESTPDLLYTQDKSGRITRVNRAFEKITGITRLDAVGMSIYDLVTPEHRELLKTKIWEHMGGASPHPFELELDTKNGRIPLEFSINVIFDEGRPAGIQGFGRDLREKLQERMQRAASDSTLLRQTEQLATFSRYVQLLHRLSTTNYPHLDDLLADYLSTGCEIFNVDCGAIAEITSQGIVTRRACNADHAQVAANAERVLSSGETIVQVRQSADQAFFFAGTRLVVSGERYGALAFWSEGAVHTHPQAKEIIEMMARGIESAIYQRRLTEKLEHWARHDSLTELPNRMMMSEQLELALADARDHAEMIAVLFIDLDHFKEINDTHGHAYGDLVLQQIAKRLSQAAGPDCLLARMGGDEFTAVLPRVRRQTEAVQMANRLIAALTEPCHVHGVELRVTGSIGISIFPFDGPDAATLLRKADLAMYQAKELGDNMVQCASAEASSV